MKILKFIWRKLCIPSFAIYTLLTISLSVFMTAANVTEKPALTLSSSLMLLAMSVLIAASSLIFYAGRLSLLVRTIINFFLTLLSIVAVTLLGNYEFGTRSLILIIVFTILYIIIVSIGILVYSIIKRKLSEDTEYTDVFKKEK